MHRRTLLASSLCLLFTASSALANGAPKKKGGGPGFTQFPMMSVFTRGNGHRHGTLLARDHAGRAPGGRGRGGGAQRAGVDLTPSSTMEMPSERALTSPLALTASVSVLDDVKVA